MCTNNNDLQDCGIQSINKQYLFMTFKYDRKLCCHLSNMILSFFNRQFCLRKVSFCHFVLLCPLLYRYFTASGGPIDTFINVNYFSQQSHHLQGVPFLAFIFDHLQDIMSCFATLNFMFKLMNIIEFVIFREHAFSNGEYIIICFTDTQDHLDVANYFTNIKYLL